MDNNVDWDAQLFLGDLPRIETDVNEEAINRPLDKVFSGWLGKADSCEEYEWDEEIGEPADVDIDLSKASSGRYRIRCWPRTLGDGTVLIESYDHLGKCVGSRIERE